MKTVHETGKFKLNVFFGQHGGREVGVEKTQDGGNPQGMVLYAPCSPIFKDYFGN
jgi:hypothetical protein